jgi:hypothetical protein
MPREKNTVRASGLRRTVQRQEGGMFARFRNTTGLREAEGRETLVILFYPEIAEILTAMPLRQMKDAEGMEALKMVIERLRA